MSPNAWAAWLLLASAAMVLALAVARRQVALAKLRVAEHRRGRHVVLALPQLAPERWCACGCAQLAAAGAPLADWHYQPPPGVLPPPKAHDTIPVQGIAWTYADDGTWQPAIVYVSARHQAEPAHGHPTPEAELRTMMADLGPDVPLIDPSMNGRAATNGHDPNIGYPAR